MSEYSDANMRSHIWSKHKNIDKYSDQSKVLYKSQKTRRSVKETNSKKKIDKKLKDRIDDAIVEAILIDGRSHGDFKKNGIKKVLEVLAPGYKSQCKLTISRKLKKK